MFDKDLIVEIFDDLLGLLPSAQGNNNSAAYNNSWWLIVQGRLTIGNSIDYIPLQLLSLHIAGYYHKNNSRLLKL